MCSALDRALMDEKRCTGGEHQSHGPVAKKKIIIINTILNN